MPAQKGFTLIELLIVISIIAILSAVGLVAYGNFLKNSRDARRQADLKFIQSALEEYQADQFFYPGSMSFSSTFSLTNSTGNPNPTSGTKTYLNNVPIGPATTSEYQYSAYKCSDATCSAYEDCAIEDNLPASTGKCVKYCLYAKIERTTAPPSDGGCDAFPPGGYNYGVSKP